MNLKHVYTFFKEFHNELMQKKRMVEEFTKPPKKKPLDRLKSRISRGRNAKQTNGQELKNVNPRTVTLQNKWKLLWKMSNDRKKKLQEIFSNLIEVFYFCFNPVLMKYLVIWLRSFTIS